MQQYKIGDYVVGRDDTGRPFKGWIKQIGTKLFGSDSYLICTNIRDFNLPSSMYGIDLIAYHREIEHVKENAAKPW